MNELINVERFGAKFTVTTKPYGNDSVKVIEEKNAEGLIEWFKAKEAELSKLKDELDKNNGLITQMSSFNEEEERVYQLLKERVDACKTLDDLKTYLLDLTSGRMQKQDKTVNLEDNVKYLSDKHDSLKAVLTQLNAHLVEAKRLASVKADTVTA